MANNSSSQTGKCTAGRPRSRPIKVYLQPADREIVVQFLQVRLDQCVAGIRKLCHGLTMAEIAANRGQLDWFKTEESVIKRLISTVTHPIGYRDPDTGDMLQ